MHGGAPDQHAVEPEHERRHAGRKSQELPRLVRLHEPMEELVAGVLVVRERPEQGRGRLALALEPGRLHAACRIGEIAPRRAERLLGGVERQPPLRPEQVRADGQLLAGFRPEARFRRLLHHPSLDVRRGRTIRVLHGTGSGIRSSPPGE